MMPRQSLPQEYVTKAGIIFEDFENLADWTGVTNGTLSDDYQNFKTGTKSLKLSHTYGAGTYAFATKTISTQFSDKSECLHLWVYLDIAAPILIYLSSTTDFSKYFLYNASITTHQGWNHIAIGREQWSNTGGESWSNTMIRMRIRVQANMSGQTVNASFDSISTDAVGIPKCLVVFDDAKITAYTEGYSYMDVKKIKGTIYTIPKNVGKVDYMSLSQLIEAYNKGWAISNHTYNHVNLTTLATEEDVKKEISQGTDWLTVNGFSRSALHLAYPFGGYNDTVLNSVKALNLKTARCSVGGSLGKLQATPVDDVHQLTILNLGYTVTIATAKALLDNAIQTGSTVIYLAHNLVNTTPAVDEDWAVSDFRTLIDYISQRKIDSLTIDEWFEGCTNPRYKSLPLDRSVV